MPDCLHIIAMLASLYALSPGELMQALDGVEPRRQSAIIEAVAALREYQENRACEIVQELDDP